MKTNLLVSIFSVFVLAFFVFPLIGFSQIDGSSAPEPIEYVLENIQGLNVQVLEDGSKDWEAAEEGQVLETGDEIKVGDGCDATLSMQSDTQIHLSAGSDLKVEQIQANETGGFLSRLKLLAGVILSDVKKNLQDSHSSFEIEANGVVCGVRGTAFEMNAQGANVQTTTYEGKVEALSGGESHMVTAGNVSAFRVGRFQMQRRVDRAETQRFMKWRNFREKIRQIHRQRLLEIRSGRRHAWKRRHAHRRVIERRRPRL